MPTQPTIAAIAPTSIPPLTPDRETICAVTVTINKNGVVNVNGGTLNVTDGAVLTTSGTITATDASITAGIVDTNRRLKIVRDGDVSAAATATVEFYSAYGKTGTKKVSFEAGKDTVYLDVDAFSYKYKVICNGVPSSQCYGFSCGHVCM